MDNKETKIIQVTLSLFLPMLQFHLTDRIIYPALNRVLINYTHMKSYILLACVYLLPLIWVLIARKLRFCTRRWMISGFGLAFLTAMLLSEQTPTSEPQLKIVVHLFWFFTYVVPYSLLIVCMIRPSSKNALDEEVQSSPEAVSGDHFD